MMNSNPRVYLLNILKNAPSLRSVYDSDLSDRLSTPFALIALLVVWEIIGRLSNALFFPPFSSVIQAWWNLVVDGLLFSALLTSVQALLIGFGLAFILGVLLGSAMGLSNTIRSFFDIYVNTMMAAPLIALIPIIAIFLGLDLWARTSIVFIFAFFVITLNTEAGMKAVPPEILEMTRAFGLDRWQSLILITLPAATPAILSGVRLGIVRAVKGMVTAEMFMALTGLGALLDYYGSQFKADELFAVLLTVIALSLLAGAAVNQLDRRLTRWQRGGSHK